MGALCYVQGCTECKLQAGGIVSTKHPEHVRSEYVTMDAKFITKDSGDREEFDSGMVRDTNGGKPRFDLLIPKGVPFEDLYLTRIARLYERGAVKYAPRNWEKANSQEELDRAKESAFRHFMQWFAGELDEDHAAAVFFNVNEVETIRCKLRK